MICNLDEEISTAAPTDESDQESRKGGASEEFDGSTTEGTTQTAKSSKNSMRRLRKGFVKPLSRCSQAKLITIEQQERREERERKDTRRKAEERAEEIKEKARSIADKAVEREKLTKKIEKILEGDEDATITQRNEKIISLIDEETQGQWLSDLETEKVKELMKRLAATKSTDYLKKLAVAILMGSKGIDTATYNEEVETVDPMVYEKLFKNASGQ